MELVEGLNNWSVAMQLVIKAFFSAKDLHTVAYSFKAAVAKIKHWTSTVPVTYPPGNETGCTHNYHTCTENCGNISGKSSESRLESYDSTTRLTENSTDYASTSYLGNAR